MAVTKRKLIYPVVVLLVFLCLVGIGALYVQLKDLDALRDMVVQEIKAETRRDVLVDSAHLDFSEGIGLQLHDVTLKGASEKESDFFCKEVLVLLDALPLLKGEIKIQKLIFEGLILQVTRGEQGAFNFGELSLMGSPRSGATFSNLIQAGLIHNVQVRKGELWLVDHSISTGTKPLITKIKNMSLSLSKPLTKGSLRVHLSGEVPFAKGESGSLKLDAKIRIPHDLSNLSQVAVDGNLEIRNQGTQPFALYLDKVFEQNPGDHRVSLDTRFAGTLDGHIQLSGILKHTQKDRALQPGLSNRAPPVNGSLHYNLIFNGDTVEFKQLDYHAGTFSIKIKGTYARFLSEQAWLTVSMNTSPFKIENIDRHLPFKVFGRNLHRRLHRLLKKGEVEITSLRIEGPRAIFKGRSNAEIQKHDSGSVILRHADFGVDALPLQDVTGTFELKNGVARVKIQEARFDRVSIKNFYAVITDPLTEPRIEGTLEAQGALAPLAHTIEKNWTLPRQLAFLKNLKRIQGIGRARVSVRGPLEAREQLVWSGDVFLERAGFVKKGWPAPILNINGRIHFKSPAGGDGSGDKGPASQVWTLRFENFSGEYENHYFREVNGTSHVENGIPVKKVQGSIQLGELKAGQVIAGPFEGTLKAFLKNILFESGEIDFSLQSTGPGPGKNPPQNKGSLKIKKLFLKHSKGYRPIRDLNATISFDDRNIVMATAGGWYGDSPFNLKGSLKNYSEADPELILQANSAEFLKQDFAGIPFLETLEYRGPAKVDLKFHRTGQFMKLDNRVDLTRASYRYQDFLIKPENVSNSIELFARLGSGGRVDFKKVVFELEGNKVTGKGFLKSMDDPEFSIQLGSDHFKVWPASQYIRPLQGALGGESRFQISAKGNFRNLQDARIEGKIQLKDIEYKPEGFLSSFKISADMQFQNNRFKLRKGKLDAKGSKMFFSGNYRGGRTPHMELQMVGPSLDLNQLVSDKGESSQGFLGWLSHTHVFSNGSGKVEIKVNRFTRSFLTLPEVTGTFTFKDRILRTDNLTVGLPQIDQLTLKGQLNLADSQNPEFKGFLVSRNVPVEGLFAMFGGMFSASLTGHTVWMKAHFQSRGSDLKQIVQSLKGRISFNIKKGRINNGRLLNGVARLFEVSVDPGTIARRSGQPNSGYLQIFGDFSILNGVARTENFMFEDKGERLSLAGAFDLNTRRMDTVVGLAPFRRVGRFIEKIPVIGKILTGGEEGSLITTYYKVEGPFDDPKVEAVPLQSVGKKLLGTLEGIISIPSDLFAEKEPASP